MWVLLLHQMREVVLEFVNQEYALGSITELHERLQNTAPIMFVTELRVLLPDCIYTLLHNSVFLISSQLFFLHQEPIVWYTELLDQIRHSLLLASIQHGLLAWSSFLLTISVCTFTELRPIILLLTSFSSKLAFFKVSLALSCLITILDLLENFLFLVGTLDSCLTFRFFSHLFLILMLI